jgi:multiple sugar transport system permease protein
MKQFLSRLAIYFLLITGSAIFLVPLLWMLSTALKPIEQTMSMPPTWIPYRLYQQQPTGLQEVKRLESIEVPSTLIEFPDSKERTIIPNQRLKNGQLKSTDAVGAEILVPVTIVKEIPATRENPWYRISKIEPAGEGHGTEVGKDWEVVPASSVIQKAAFHWDNFSKAVKAMKFFPMYLKNTLILCFLTILGTVTSSALAAYGFARIPWRGRNKVFIIALATMMVPFPVVMVPIYSLFRALGWIGTLKPLWVGSFCAAAFNVFLLRQFFMTIPKDLSDAARIDGCGEFRIFLQIILPLCKPALMVIGLFQFMASWNDFLGPLIYLTNQKDFTLALGLQFFQSQHGGTEWHYLMAASTLIVLPVIVLFFFTQKTFIEGISMTGIKG